MNRPAIVALSLALMSCGGGDSSTPTQPPTGAVPTSITFSVTNLNFPSLGVTEQLSVTIRDQNGDPMTATVTWSSSDPQVASVSSAGLVTSVANGTAIITAAAGSASATLGVTVEQVVVGIRFSQSVVSMSTLDGPVTLEAEGVDANGHAAALGPVTWASSAPDVLTVDASGVITPVSPGWALVRATALPGTWSATVHVVAPGFPGPAPDMRAVHMGGNWLGNQLHAGVPHGEWVRFMQSINANWAGISVALHYGQADDPVIRRIYEGVGIRTFTDDVLRTAIRELRARGIDVYVTLAFEPDLDPGQPDRTVLGQPFLGGDVEAQTVGDWPWHPDHPQHEEFVAQFWASYTEQAVHFARIAEEEGAALFSVGTETEQLFRTRTAGPWVTEFRDQIQTMVSEVRGVFTGMVTYDQVYSALIDSDFWWDLPQEIWTDVDFDAIGISAYFRLATGHPTRVMTVTELQRSWEKTFADYMVPLAQAHPELPILFTEFGYVDDIRAPADPTVDQFLDKVFLDTNGNGLDDGQEVQANILEAYFRTLETYPIVDATFLWDHAMDADAEIEVESRLVSTRVRGKLAEEVVRQAYRGGG
jgi:uncharacterized protein YjdB